MADEGELSDAELEDGEVLSSEEEGEGPNASKDHSLASLSSSSLNEKSTTEVAQDDKGDVEDVPPDTNHQDAGANDPNNSTGEGGRGEGCRTGEIYSDDEEAAYFPSRVRSRHYSRGRSPPSTPSTETSKFRVERSSPLSQTGRVRHRSSSSERGMARVNSNRKLRSPRKRRFRSSDEDERDLRNTDEQDYSKNRRNRERDSYSSARDRPGRSQYGSGNWKDSGRGNDSGDSGDFHHHGNSNMSKGGRGRRFGGYGQTRTYQQRTGGGKRFGRGSNTCGTNYGGYSGRAYHSNNTEMKNNCSSPLASMEDVVTRLQKGLSLLPSPKERQSDNLDQFNYPAPPSWYLEEVEEWERREASGERQVSVAEEVGREKEDVPVGDYVAVTKTLSGDEEESVVGGERVRNDANLDFPFPPPQIVMASDDDDGGGCVGSAGGRQGSVPASSCPCEATTPTISSPPSYSSSLSDANGRGVAMVACDSSDKSEGEGLDSVSSALSSLLTSMRSCISTIPPPLTAVPAVSITVGSDDDPTSDGGRRWDQIQLTEDGCRTVEDQISSGSRGSVSNLSSGAVTNGIQGSVANDPQSPLVDGIGVFTAAVSCPTSVSDEDKMEVTSSSAAAAAAVDPTSLVRMGENSMRETSVDNSAIVSLGNNEVGMPSNDRMGIVKINPQEQFIHLSDISRVHVYVSPVTSTNDTAQNAYPKVPPTTTTTPMLPVALVTTPISPSSSPSEEHPMQQSDTSPTAAIITEPILLPSLPSTEQLADGIDTSHERIQLAEEEAGVVYSLRSRQKAANERKREAGSALKRPPVFRPKMISASDDGVNYDDYLDQLVDEEEDDKNPVTIVMEDSLTSTLSKSFPVVGSKEEKAEVFIKRSVEDSLTSALSGGFPLVGGKEKATGKVVELSLGDQLSRDFPVMMDKASLQVVEPSCSLKSLLCGNLIVTGEDLVDGSESVGEIGSKQPARASKRISAHRQLKSSLYRAKQLEREKKATELQQLRPDRVKAKGICKYYLNNFCVHGSACEYSHDGTPSKKREICKFFLMDTCTKGTSCNYYHESFPCKFFHKSYCKNGDHCKFSHAPLTPDTHGLLMSVLGADMGNLLLPITSKEISDDVLLVSFPLSKLDERLRLKSFSIPKLKSFCTSLSSTPISMTSSFSVSLPQHNGGTISPYGTPQQSLGVLPGQIPFQSIPGQVPFSSPVPNVKQNSTNIVAVPLSNQSQPVPLFPPKSMSGVPPPSLPPHPPVPPHGPLPQAPFVLPSSILGILPASAPPTTMAVPPIVVPPIGENPERRVLLPTPPNNMKLLPDDFKKMKQVEYWEDSTVNQLITADETSLTATPQVTPMMTQNASSPLQYHGPPPHSNVGGVDIRLDPRQSRSSVVSDQDPRLGGQWQSTRNIPPLGPPECRLGTPECRLGTSMEQPPQVVGSYPNPMDPAPMTTPYQSEPVLPSAPYMYQQPERARVTTPYPSEPMRVTAPHPPNPSTGGFSPDQRHFTADQPPVVWGVSGRSPEQSHGSLQHHQQMGGVTGSVAKVEDLRRMDPRRKYAHLKIRSKGASTGGSSPAQSQSSSSTMCKKKAQGEDIEGSGRLSFEVPRLLQDPSALKKPINACDLFKNTNSSEDSYGVSKDDEAGPFGLFKSNFFSSRMPAQDNSGDRKTGEFGEITLDQVISNKQDVKTDPLESQSNTTEMDSMLASESAGSDDMSMPAKPQVPSYFANLDIGLGKDLQIESALGALASKNEVEGEVITEENKVKLQARKLPSMFGLGF